MKKILVLLIAWALIYAPAVAQWQAVLSGSSSNGGAPTNFTIVNTQTYQSTTNNATHSITLGTSPLANTVDYLAIGSQAVYSSGLTGWTQIAHKVNSTGVYVYRRANVGGESATASVTLNASVNCCMYWWEVSGMFASPDDANTSDPNEGVNSYTGTSPSSGTTGTPVQNNEFFVVAFSSTTNPTATITLSNSYVLDASLSATTGTFPINLYVGHIKWTTTAVAQSTTASASASINGESTITSGKILNP